ncbi:MAG: 30S ribosomal protein S20 [Gammaproteobacteria bacterium]
MANTKQALKRTRQNEKRRMRNRWQLSRMRSQIKTVLKAIETGSVNEASTEYREAASLVDRLVAKGMIHKNKASRHKSRLSIKLKQVAKA